MFFEIKIQNLTHKTCIMLRFLKNLGTIKGEKVVNKYKLLFTFVFLKITLVQQIIHLFYS